jgi:hypothetical protein
MIKKILSFILVCGLLAGVYTAYAVNGESIGSLAAEFDNINRNLTVTGVISSGEGHQVTLAVLSPSEKVVTKQTTSVTGGEFEFSVKIPDAAGNAYPETGTYKVRVGGFDVGTPAVTEFSYHIPNSVSDFESFKVSGINGVISGTGITVKLPSNTDSRDVLETVPVFTVSSNAAVKVGNEIQLSGANKRNFTSSVIYTVYAEDFDLNPGHKKDYTVEVYIDTTPVTGGGGGGGGGTAGRNSSGYEPGITLAPTGGSDLPVFSDVMKDRWSCLYIESLAKSGIITLPPDALFYPGREVTREEFVKMITGAFSCIDESAEVDFSDVSVSDWFYSYVASAYNQGIVNGISDTEFGSGLKITRQDMAVMAYRAVQKFGRRLDNTDSGERFADDEYIRDYARDAVYAMRAAGIISGTGNGAFEPDMYATREQAAKIIYYLSSL